ncbi:hypothetical protein F183_A41200 [Bryobacterales bacterium F-183]|nr:hypothetical protein F183_A41200 [Bryobacterales bacterium F-183]
MNPEQRIIVFLHTHRTLVESLTLDMAVESVIQGVFLGPPPISKDEVRRIVSGWAMFNAPAMLRRQPVSGPKGIGPDPPPPVPISNSDLLDSVKKALKTVTDGVKIGNDKHNVTVLVTGAAVNLFDGTVTLESSWTGTLELGVNAGPLHFSGKLGQEEWQIEVTFPNDTALPSAASLGKVFGEGEAAMRKLARESRNIKNLDDAKRMTALLKPEIAAVQEAADAVMKIAKKTESKGGFDVGFKFGNPPPGPNQEGIPKGYEGTIVFTYRW